MVTRDDDPADKYLEKFAFPRVCNS